MKIEKKMLENEFGWDLRDYDEDYEFDFELVCDPALVGENQEPYWSCSNDADLTLSLAEMASVA